MSDKRAEIEEERQRIMAVVAGLEEELQSKMKRELDQLSASLLEKLDRDREDKKRKTGVKLEDWKEDGLGRKDYGLDRKDDGLDRKDNKEEGQDRKNDRDRKDTHQAAADNHEQAAADNHEQAVAISHEETAARNRDARAEPGGQSRGKWK